MVRFQVMQMHTVLDGVSLNIVIWSHLVLIGVVEDGQLPNLRLQKVEGLLSDEKGKKGGDREVRKDGKPLVRG
ncbi:hypothetical protein DEO72_LG3g1346 [Vigna unguiculata]|uniref:Uncharacterized protein n=1 Tax=Vigna unguiculata TaxID=3917 RepID=A0A4D6LEB4_VIGUN|nr:hypothetical protein DEO72_LG3g656 [Vigna unguiculata]QCD86141.1 hypothetical protein DEO72_LG3g662 [Vigna unguiculata]QCD86820.1 hypothetical protein DEO72_LG3g1346 [Vigna unguiculata]